MKSLLLAQSDIQAVPYGRHAGIKMLLKCLHQSVAVLSHELLLWHAAAAFTEMPDHAGHVTVLYPTRDDL